MENVIFKWPAAWRLAGPLPAAERNQLIVEVEAGASLLLHLRDDALKWQLAKDIQLQQWLRDLLLRLPSAHELFSADFTPLPQRTQRILLRVFLRLGKLHLQEQQQQYQLLPCTACLLVGLSWELADPYMCATAAGALLASLKPMKRQRLIEELRQSLPCAIEAAAKTLTALGRRYDSPLLQPAASVADAAGAPDRGAACSWLEAAAAALQPLLEALATLRVATCCLPVDFVLKLWDQKRNWDRPAPTIEEMLTSLTTPQPPQSPQSPFAASLRRVYAALASPPWFVSLTPSESLLPPRLHQGAARARLLVCSCLVGNAAAQSRAVREELLGGGSRRPSSRLLQQAEEWLQDWGASLIQLFEAVAAEGGATYCLVRDLQASGASRLLQQWRSLDMNPDLLGYIELILSPHTAHGEEVVGKKAPKPAAPVERCGEASWALTSRDAETVAQLQELLPEHGLGYLYLALRELRGNADEVVSLLLESKAPASLRSVPRQATLQDAATFLEAETNGRVVPHELSSPSSDLERRILALAERAAEEVWEGSDDSDDLLYDDDADEELLEDAAAQRNAAESEVEEHSSSEESEREGAGHGTAIRGVRMPVRGGTLAARRKETHKASVANHSRRNQRRRKVERCLGP